MRTSDRNDWRRALTGEPAFDEVLADPIVNRLMDRDGVSADDLHRLRSRHAAAMDAAA